MRAAAVLALAAGLLLECRAASWKDHFPEDKLKQEEVMELFRAAHACNLTEAGEEEPKIQAEWTIKGLGDKNKFCPSVMEKARNVKTGLESLRKCLKIEEGKPISPVPENYWMLAKSLQNRVQSINMCKASDFGSKAPINEEIGISQADFNMIVEAYMENSDPKDPNKPMKPEMPKATKKPEIGKPTKKPENPKPTEKPKVPNPPKKPGPPTKKPDMKVTTQKPKGKPPEVPMGTAGMMEGNMTENETKAMQNAKRKELNDKLDKKQKALLAGLKGAESKTDPANAQAGDTRTTVKKLGSPKAGEVVEVGDVGSVSFRDAFEKLDAVGSVGMTATTPDDSGGALEGTAGNLITLNVFDKKGKKMSIKSDDPVMTFCANDWTEDACEDSMIGTINELTGEIMADEGATMMWNDTISCCEVATAHLSSFVPLEDPEKKSAQSLRGSVLVAILMGIYAILHG